METALTNNNLDIIIREGGWATVFKLEMLARRLCFILKYQTKEVPFGNSSK